MCSKISLVIAGLMSFGCWPLFQGSSRCESAAPSNTNQVYVIPFSHLDLMWAGTREECLSRGSRIIAKAIQIAQRHPEFRFLLEDQVFVASYVDAHRGSPELQELKRLVKEGRIELAPKWAGIYQNLPRGEALVRNVVYGKQYAREVFGVDPQVAHLCDIPGFTAQLPQIYAKSDTPFMVMTRMGPPDCSLFRYRSPDGSSVLVWDTIKGYGWGVGLGLHRGELGETNFTKISRSVSEVQATTAGPIYMGWGTDLFAPNDNLVSNMPLLSERLNPKQFHLATPAEFFQAAAKVDGVKELTGEIPSSWANLLTSNGQLWPPTVLATDTLLSAEKFAAINYALGYADYPQQEFETLWKCAIDTMDHNNYGQGGEIGDARKLEYAATATMRGGEILRQMLRNIAERVQSPFPRCAPIVVFNPLNWTRDDVVKAHVSQYGDVAPGDIGDYRQAMRLVDETGASVPFHVEQSYGTVSRACEIVFVASGVPSMGYKTYFMVPTAKAEVFPDACKLKLEDPEGRSPKRVIGTDQVENDFYRVTVDRMTGRITIFDKELNRAVAKDMEIVAAETRGGNSISTGALTGRTIINSVRRAAVEENNAARTVLRIEGDLAGVPVVQKLTLYRSIKRIDVENILDWQEGRLMKIEQLIPYEHPQARIRYGIPFGSADASDIMPNSGPHSGDEVSREEWLKLRQIQDWVFAGSPEWGLTVAVDRQLMILDEGLLRLGMLRGTFSTTGFTRADNPVLIPVPPAGKYVFHYSLCSGKGDWAGAKSYRVGLAATAPLIPVPAADELSGKCLPPTRSFCSLAADNLLVTALKKSEHDNAVVLRAVEMLGAPSETAVEFTGGKCGVRALNLLEEQASGGEEQNLKASPYEIITVKLSKK